VYATLMDVLDLWGPGRLLYDSDGKNLRAVSIGGGIIFPTDEIGRIFHWSDRETDGQVDIILDLCTKVTIGSLVKINSKCSIDERNQWLKSFPAFESLGTYDTRWEPHERAIEFQAGQYLLGQVNQTWQKIQGKTLKRVYLEQGDELLVSALEFSWGLQVSFCTGVARRVLLRDLVADMLPIFAKSMVVDQGHWDELCIKHQILEVFQKGEIAGWLQSLPDELQRYALKLIRRILELLQNTGVDQEGSHLRVAWPQVGDLLRCFKIPCQKQSFWARILADSADCATFAYISSKCLESDRVKCSGPCPTWRNSSALLETAVVRHVTTPDGTPWSLQHKQVYYVRKLNSLFLIKVHRPDEQESASLIASNSAIPNMLQQRLFMRERWKRDFRLKERQIVEEVAEQVIVAAIITQTQLD